MKKILFTLFLFLNFYTLCWAEKQRIMFVNCTGKPIEVFNTANPYKFSLTSEQASNGYSSKTHFTIPSSQIFNYPYYLTSYFKEFYIDGSMRLRLNGIGDLYFEQQPPPAIIRISSSSPKITIDPSSFMMMSERTRSLANFKLVIAIGCSAQ